MRLQRGCPLCLPCVWLKVMLAKERCKVNQSAQQLLVVFASDKPMNSCVTSLGQSQLPKGEDRDSMTEGTGDFARVQIFERLCLEIAIA